MPTHRNYFKIKIIINYFQLLFLLSSTFLYSNSEIISHQNLVASNITTLSTSNSSDLLPVIECQNTTYTSLNTRCQLSFMYCANVAIYQGCIKKQCVKYIRGSDCALEYNIILQEKQCLNYCCGIKNSIFNEQACNNYNSNLNTVQSKWQGGLIAVLAVSAAILLSVIAFFIIKKQKCCQNNQPIRLMKFNVKWRADIWEDRKCDICKTHGAMLITPCNHSFHASCFQQGSTQKNLPTCPTCEKVIEDRIKIFCFSCRAKSFKIKLWKIDMLSDIMAQGKALHDDICSKQVKTPSNQDLLSSQGP